MSLALDIQRYTYDDYKLWKGDWELIEGIPQAMSPSPVRDHQGLTTFMSHLLLEEIEECEECQVVSELDYVVDDENILRPDIALICNEDNDYIIKPPKIVVEVLSPSTAIRDKNVKFKIYEEQHIPYYVMLDTRTLTAKIYKLEDKKYSLDGVIDDKKYKFKLEECEDIEIDFKRLFKKFKNKR